jgi:hypothetical protein
VHRLEDGAWADRLFDREHLPKATVTRRMDGLQAQLRLLRSRPARSAQVWNGADGRPKGDSVARGDFVPVTLTSASGT